MTRKRLPFLLAALLALAVVLFQAAAGVGSDTFALIVGFCAGALAVLTPLIVARPRTRARRPLIEHLVGHDDANGMQPNEPAVPTEQRESVERLVSGEGT